MDGVVEVVGGIGVGRGGGGEASPNILSSRNIEDKEDK
jgi:hypothetical protein